MCREAATLNGQRTASLSFHAENVNDSVCLQKFVDLVRRRNFPKRRLLMAMQAYLCERNFRAGAMVDGIQTTCSNRGWLCGGNGFARVLHDNLECADHTLPALLPAPELPRQFVDDLATTVLANTDDDVVTTICSDERRKTGTLVKQDQIHDRQQSQHACRKKTKSTLGVWLPATSGRCRARSGYLRCWRSKRRRKTRNQDSEQRSDGDSKFEF